MSIEKFEQLHKIDQENEVVISKIDEGGNPVYKEANKDIFFTEYPAIPHEVFDLALADFEKLPPNSTVLKYKQGDIVTLSVNSTNKKRYEILDARKGYYLISKIDNDLVQIGQISELRIELSNDKRSFPNPEVLVCTQDELSNWMR